MRDQFDLFGYSLYGGEPPSVRGSETSRKAAASIKRRIGALHQTVLAYLRANPRGATDERMQREIPMPANTQRPRRIELTTWGHIVDSGRREPTKAKRAAVIWVLKEHADN